MKHDEAVEKCTHFNAGLEVSLREWRKRLSTSSRKGKLDMGDGDKAMSFVYTPDAGQVTEIEIRGREGKVWPREHYVSDCIPQSLEVAPEVLTEAGKIYGMKLLNDIEGLRDKILQDFRVYVETKLNLNTKVFGIHIGFRDVHAAPMSNMDELSRPTDYTGDLAIYLLVSVVVEVTNQPDFVYDLKHVGLRLSELEDVDIGGPLDIKFEHVPRDIKAATDIKFEGKKQKGKRPFTAHHYVDEDSGFLPRDFASMRGGITDETQ